MKKMMLGMTLTILSLTSGYCNANVETVNPDGTYTVGPGGCVD